jgi:hypothetical protein
MKGKAVGIEMLSGGCKSEHIPCIGHRDLCGVWCLRPAVLSLRCKKSRWNSGFR